MFVCVLLYLCMGMGTWVSVCFAVNSVVQKLCVFSRDTLVHCVSGELFSFVTL